MSIRTIIEINHDYLHELRRDGNISERFERWILDRTSDTALDATVSGVLVLGSRHHSESLELKIV